MNKKIRTVIKFFLKRYWLFLMLVVIVSYGLLLLMFPWQDDHTLFFKLAHIEERAGYFGTGSFGQGVYKYIATPYILVYKIFGLNPTFFFAFAISFYFLATLTVYKVFSEIIGDRGGRVAGFLYAAGYVASDGYVRIFNSVSTSLGIILVSLLLLSYWKFFKKGKYFWYFSAVVFYYLALEFGRLRTHYLIGVVLAFEAFFFAFKDRLKSATRSIIRLVPFAYIFYRYFVDGADSRSAQVGVFFQSLLKGEFHKLYSFLSAITSIIFPDWLLEFLFGITKIYYLYAGFLVIFVAAFSRLLKNPSKKKRATLFFLVASIAWIIISRTILSAPTLNLQARDFLAVFLGGEIIMLVPAIAYRLEKKWRTLFVFLFLWLVLNISSYSVYNPALGFVQFHRYLAHSFLALVGILGLLSLRSNLVLGLVLIWGVTNLISSVSYQQTILKTRSFPVKDFYRELRVHVPTIKKGDVFYFDVADNARSYFSDAFSVASMPEETAIAWQYGVDRYDIRRVTEFDDLLELVNEDSFTDINNEPTQLSNIYSFFYSKNGLVNTTEELRVWLKSEKEPKKAQAEIIRENDEIYVNFNEPIVSITPNVLSLGIKASPPNSDEIEFPYVTNQNLVGNDISQDQSSRKLAFEYRQQKNSLVKNSQVGVSNFWKKDIAENLVDGRNDTFWRADRVLWSKEGAFLTLDLGKSVSIDRFVWTNGYAPNTPTKYKIEVSLDSKNWQRVAEVSSLARIEPGKLQVVSFDPVNARYVRMTILETLSRDSASVAEVWVVPAGLAGLNIKEAEKFLVSPLGFVPDEQSFRSTLSQMNYIGKIQVSWWGDKSESWQTRTTIVLEVKYDGISRTYSLLLPAGGTKIKKLKLSQNQIPGTLNINSITVE